jgi:alpha-ribazole phosphatase
MEIYLVRHPQADIERGICYGQTDVALKPENIDIALQKIKMVIPDITDFVIYSSDLIRCKTIAQRLGTEDRIFYSDKIREINFGNWEMKHWDEIPKDELNAWMKDFVNQNSYNGESYNDLYMRTIQFWKELINMEHSKIMVITHGGVIRSILCYILNISLSNSFKLSIDFSSISKVKINNKTERIEFINK